MFINARINLTYQEGPDSEPDTSSLDLRFLFLRETRLIKKVMGMPPIHWVEEVDAGDGDALMLIWLLSKNRELEAEGKELLKVGDLEDTFNVMGLQYEYESLVEEADEGSEDPTSPEPPETTTPSKTGGPGSTSITNTPRKN